MSSSLATSTFRERAIVHAREQALLRREMPTGIESWITQSWQRCLGWGHEPHHRVGFDLISHAHQRRTREANRQLALASQTTLHELAQAIAPIGYFALVTNGEGIVVGSQGASTHHDPRAHLIAREGVDLSERAVGTSAIGATLHEQREVWLHRGEHFFNDTGCYSCAGAPIFAGDGRCAGMLDVTGIDVPERPELVHLVSSAARRIEAQLVLSTPHTLVVHLRWPGSALAGREAEGLVCLGEDGEVQAMNTIARQMLGLQSLPMPSQANELFATDTHRLYDLALASKAITVPLWSGLPIELRTSRSGKLSPRVAAAPVDTRTGQHVGALKAHEADIIRDTVTQLKGNVAAAAQKLGISRATIYRKLHIKGRSH